MAKDTLKLADPALNEYVYSALYSASFEDRLKLPHKYQRIVKSEKAAKAFINTSSLDEKINILNCLGYKSFFVMVEHEDQRPDLKKVLDLFKQKQANLSFREIVESGMYITSSKQLIGVLGLMAQSVHSSVYKLNLELGRAGYNLKKWSRTFDNGQALGELEQQRQNDLLLVKTFSSNHSVIKRSKELFRMNENHLHVLLFLYANFNSYVEIQAMWSFFVGVLSKLEVSSAVKNLIETKHIEKHPFSKKREYTITTLGIRVVNQYKEAVHNNTNFN